MKITRNHYGLNAQTIIELPNNRSLIFETFRRYDKNLATTISVFEKMEGGRKTIIGQDYRQIIDHGNVGRLTVNVLKDRHSVVLTAINSFEKEAIEFYSNSEVQNAL